MNKKIIFLVSGNGGTLKFLYFAIRMLNLPFEITTIISDRVCGAYDFALKNKINAYKINYSKDNDTELINLLKNIDSDIIITNIHKILSEEVLNSTKADFINLHYSLLPSFAGLIGMKTVLEAKKQNCQFIGATCHEVTKDLDGGRIICQGIYPVDWAESEEIIQNKVFRIACLCILNSLIYKYLEYDNSHNSDYALFNPSCRFNIELFNNNFWENIK